MSAPALQLWLSMNTEKTDFIEEFLCILKLRLGRLNVARVPLIPNSLNHQVKYGTHHLDTRRARAGGPPWKVNHPHEGGQPVD